MKKTIHSLIFCLAFSVLFSQDCRYLQEIFPLVKRTDDLVYGRNATILYFPIFGEAIPENLLFDLYEPEGDTDTLRPLIIYFHSGNFLPYPQNQSRVGSRKDVSSVDICTQLAKSGFVVASADYRLGWNPLEGSEVGRRTGIINAAYRAVQDANTCIRFFRKTVAEDGNPFRIDQNRIVLLGDDTGGYISVHAASLDSYEEIFECGQFVIPIDDPPIPMVIKYLSGDIEGKEYGVNTPAVPIFPWPAGDTLNYPNYPEYSSSFRLAVNLGGAVACESWLDPGQIPITSVHNIYDPTTPYDEGVVFLPGIGNIMYVWGSQSIAEILNGFGVNNGLKTVESCFVSNFQKEVDAAADNLNEGLLGLFPIVPPDTFSSTPWVWFDPADPTDSSQYDIAQLYLDSVLAFVMPQMFAYMNLNELAHCGCVEVKNVTPDEIGIHIDPNPATDNIVISSGDSKEMRLIRMYDMRGVMVKEFIPGSFFHQIIPVDQYPPGVYLIQVQFDDVVSTKQIVVQ